MSTQKTTKPTVPAATRRQFTGKVLRRSGEKTIAVSVARTMTHPKYHKQYERSKTFLVDDSAGIAKVGMIVVFEECRPLSRMKRWRLIGKAA